MLAPCAETIADPLTTADPFDLARALTQAVGAARSCQAKHHELAGAVRTRQATQP